MGNALSTAGWPKLATSMWDLKVRRFANVSGGDVTLAPCSVAGFKLGDFTRP